MIKFFKILKRFSTFVENSQKIIEEDGKILTDSVMQEKTSFRERNFVDKTRVVFQGGKGGSGCLSYFKDRLTVKGEGDGGDGGRGGNIILKATSYFDDLRIFRRRKIMGNDGKNGRHREMTGREGRDLTISVPVGTLIYQIMAELRQSDEIEPQKRKNQEYYQVFLKDLDTLGQEYLLCKGGAGGRGNAKNKYIKTFETGKEGETKDILLELKSISDVGLVGFPNAGKSTFLASVSRTLPKIASYPFTTLTPNIGIIKFVDDYKYSICDLPGIIEDSYKNKGLGLQFLRHIERTPILAFVLDAMDDEPWKQLEILRRELLMYKPDLLERPACVLLNKCDLEINSDEKLQKLQQQTQYKCFSISSKHAFGVGEVIIYLRELVKKQQELKNLKDKQNN